MMVCQGLALLILIIIFMGPFAQITQSNSYKRNMVVLIDTSSSMATEDQRNANSIEEAARALGEIKPSEPFDPGKANEIQTKIGNPSRIELAKATLENTNVISDLQDKFNVNIFTFDSQLKPIKETGKAEESESTEETETQSISLDLAAQGESTEIGSAINEAVGKFAGREVAGVMVLSDFISVKGKDPVESARSLSTQGIPIHTLPIGLPSPPDIHVRKIIGPDVVFTGDRVPLRVQIESKGYNE